MHLFTYGTLMFSEIWDVVVGRQFNHIPAQAPNHQIFRVRDAVYPGIIAVNSPLTTDLRPLTSAPGLLYLNLNSAAFARLDAFEDDFYQRQAITVTLESGEDFEAQAYIVPNDRRDVLTDDVWTAEEFTSRGHLAEFVARYSGFKRVANN